jgi:protease-4
MPTVRAIVDNLRKAALDNRVRGVLLKPTGFESPFWGKVQEIRDAVLEFRKSGKPVYAYVDYGGDREYYLATAADKIFLMPSAALDLTGVATYQLFLRGTLDKIGAYPDLHHIGQYKTAVNTFTEKGYTAAHKEMDESMNRDLYAQIVRGIADGRKKNEAEIRKADRRWTVSTGGCVARRPGRRCGLRGTGRRQNCAAAKRAAISTPTTTGASVPRRSA